LQKLGVSANVSIGSRLEAATARLGKSTVIDANFQKVEVVREED